MWWFREDLQGIHKTLKAIHELLIAQATDERTQEEREQFGLTSAQIATTTPPPSGLSHCCKREIVLDGQRMPMCSKCWQLQSGPAAAACTHRLTQVAHSGEYHFCLLCGEKAT